MNVRIVTPAPRHSRSGNRVTALRWARVFRRLGHHVTIGQDLAGEHDLVVALHGIKSHRAIMEARCPVVVAATGTDLYQGLDTLEMQASLTKAVRVVTLQPMAIEALPTRFADKARVILQSASAPSVERPANRDTIDVCVMAHARPVKDVLLAARAVRGVPVSSRLRVVHLGGAMSEAATADCEREHADNPRYVWRGLQPRQAALRELSESDLLVVTSKMEGGANALTEAIVCGVPVLSTRIEGSIGLLGRDYPAYFDVGDAPALRALLLRFENEATFRAALVRHCDRIRPRLHPDEETRAWKALIEEL